MNRLFMVFLGILAAVGDGFAQPLPGAFHEVAPFIGFYAPDRFQTSMAFGLRYYYKLDDRFAFGALFGMAQAKQDYFKKISTFYPELGSDRVVYYGLRVMHSPAVKPVIPYLLVHLGLTQIHDESNLTFAIGLGTQILTNRNFTLRYEMVDYLFTSGKDATSWTNNNLEVVVVFGWLF